MHIQHCAGSEQGVEILNEQKALILLAASRAGKKALLRETEPIAARLLGRLGSSTRATVMSAYRIDPFRLAAKIPGYDVTIELCADTEPAAFCETLAGLAGDLQGSGCADLSASAIVVGHDYVFMPSALQPVRFQYLMRRRADFTHEAYAKRYREIHSTFGMRTKGIEGYVQFHIDPRVSDQAVKAAGFGGCEFDSVSELHLKSRGTFLLASSDNARLGAVKDEERFVDRANSIMFVSKVVARLQH
jgi:hypothetical protein